MITDLKTVEQIRRQNKDLSVDEFLLGQTGIVARRATTMICMPNPNYIDGVMYSSGYNVKAGEICLFLAEKTLSSSNSAASYYNKLRSVKVFVSGKSSYLPCQSVIYVSPKKTLDKLSFVFTGKMQNERNVIKTMVALKGGVFKNKVTKKTDYLVTNSEEHTTKYTDAKKYNTAIITENQFLSLARGIRETGSKIHETMLSLR